MPRHEYELQRETIQVINGHAQDVAEEAGYSASYAYGIVEAKVTDPFAVFVHLYAAAVRAGCDVTPWITRLRLIDEKYRPLSKEYCITSLTGKYTKETNDVPVAHIEDKSLEEQLLEVQQANAKGIDLERALMHAINERDKVSSFRRRA